MTCNGIMLVIYCLESSVFSAGAWTQEISGISDEQKQAGRIEQRRIQWQIVMPGEFNEYRIVE